MPESTGRKKILVFCRFYLAEDFRNNFAPLHDEYEFHFITDGHSPGTPDTRRAFYSPFAAQARSALLTEADIDDILIRCRYCRSVDPDLARRQIHAMAIAVEQVMDAAQPDFVISHMVDDYVGHIYATLAEKRGIRFVGYCFSYFPGVVQLTQGWDGTAFDVREPSDDETRTILDVISKRVFRQNYLQTSDYGFLRHLKLLTKHYLKYPIFGLRGLLQRDRYNLHYRITPYTADRKNLFHYPRASDFSRDWKAELETARSKDLDRKILYLPLAYVPESTIDYWIADKRAIDYEQFTLDAVRQLAETAIVIVKEHVHMQGIRSPSFYHALRQISGVINVPPSAFSNDVLECADGVIVGGGSVGVEATIRGKPVLSYAPNVYWFTASRAAELHLDDIADWSRQATDYIAAHIPLTAAEKLDFIKRCLASTIRPRPGHKIWQLIDLDHLRLILDKG